jgi:hypothetical protein
MTKSKKILYFIGLLLVLFYVHLYINYENKVPASIYQNAGMYELAERKYQERIIEKYKKFQSNRQDKSQWYYDEQIDLFYFYVETNQIEKAKIYANQINKGFRRKFIKSISSCEEIVLYHGIDSKEKALMLLSADICLK